MSFSSIPALEIFLAILGIGLLIMFCTTFFRACSRLREEQIEREAWRRTEHDGRPPPIFFIPFHGRLSQQQQQGEEDQQAVPQYNQESFTPPLYNDAGGYCGPPPSYNEVGFKPDELPPAYTEYNMNPPLAPAHTAAVQSPTQP
ncbi:uncharacterized protein si:dkey-283b1.6 [Corythoichthys intestinalis]|uniref:uncharacterized protein si:dkey-283b1.6 n=1 Tax=Corythoichthys intestinalis TaxID=161448 RepID=UPI0025A50D64|nr:uncharacterized protein si:dkey-283b1.6 [Corythoichthys intestinalis]